MFDFKLDAMPVFLGQSGPLEHVLQHDLFHIGGFTVNNHMVMALIAAALMMLTFPPLFREAHPEAPKGARNFFEAILEFLRVEVFRPALKENTDRFVPFLWTVFFFILYCNLLGVIPLATFFELISGGHLKHIGGSATGNINVTAALAACAFFCIHFAGLTAVYRNLRNGTYGHHPHHEEHSSNGQPGHETAIDQEHMRAEALPADIPGDFRAVGNPTGHYHDDEHVSHRGHGAAVTVGGASAATMSRGKSAAEAMLLLLPLYLWNFAPHPFKPQAGSSSKKGWIADIPMWGGLLVLEFIGAAIKPFALCVRLFANMVAGHIVLAVLITLILAAPGMIGKSAIGVPIGALDLMIQFLEIFVAFLQAYIFTFLTTLFIASAVAPEH